MAFQTGTSTSIEDLMQQLSTFLQANGWTEDFAFTGDPGRIAFSKNNIYVAFQYTEATDGGVMAVYQSLSNDDSTNVWLSTDDSGKGAASTAAANFDTARCVNEFAGPHTAYWFFENDSNPAYCHVVVEVDAGRYRHFGFGELEKIGDWTGGEYCTGDYWRQTASQIDQPLGTFHSTFMDARNDNSGAGYWGSIHLEGFPEQSGDPNAKWGQIGPPNQNYNQNTDRAGEPQMGIGGAQRSGINASLTWIEGTDLTGFTPLLPLMLHTCDSLPAPNVMRLLGTVPDVRIINIANFDPNQVITVAGEDWYIFPLKAKKSLRDDTEESDFNGLAYRRENA